MSNTLRRPPTRWWFWAVSFLVAYFLVARAPLPLVQSWWQSGLDDWNDSWHRRHRMVYILGAERGFMSIDSEWLVLRIDESEQVAEARIVTD